ncbi:Dimethylsulfide dehydrogenase subunit alpha precursor [Slackia heliotrinireducens]|uniref:Anaerobic dehydrogenase, typically selenocysteine-containing n=1 Tax=Slackia heliotrinireducens (strain ATCC 29202 / DSM 20476 / NCTC 11029 / RHS 1) TaxID=471855 RepID=C7N428_SLAHD|nr:molybdopterin-dependent oxidoreductase [Slackia heliotrinireducens]ACV23764.1 anaerobic dehydrogenase, typically selenocysteine-containing [Slackia heliotrinireducens DSM 20476]VEH03393.1 Dimethylsulfide dehydrogenase subunit alpha precursor [Slackia heliotrinireducens]
MKGSSTFGASSSAHALTRRSFLKTTGTLAAAGALGVGCSLAHNELQALADENADETAEKTCYLCHNFHCLGGCGLKVTVRDGHLAKIEPRQMPDDRYRKVCLRGINEVQHVYATDRLQYPMRRTGERGEGKFERISWEEAIHEIAENVKAVQEKYGAGSLYVKKSVEASLGQGFSFTDVLLNAEGGGLTGLDRGIANGCEPALQTVNANSVNSIWEWKKAATVINLGNNICESGIIWSQALVEAREAGAKVITFDPRFSPTAAKSDQWVPVKPAEDGAVVLGMIYHILDQGWYDQEFMAAHTSLPFLVDVETGQLVGEVETGVNRLGKEEQPIVHSVVFSQSAGMPVPYDAPEAADAMLEGTWSYEGRQVTTQFMLLKDQMAQYDLAWAAGRSGISEDVIMQLADDYANRGPAIINYGIGGPDKYANADVLGHSIAILVALTGNYGKAGAGCGFYNSGGGGLSGALNPWPLPEFAGLAENKMRLYEVASKPNDIHAAITFGDAFTLRAANANATVEWIKSMDFFAIIDIYHSSAVDYADIVLPACSKFENTEDYKNVRISQNHVYIAQKCIDPLFESKTDLEIERLLMAEWGYDQYLPQSYDELNRHQLENLEGPLAGITYDKLIENDCCLPLAGGDDPIEPQVGYHEPVIKTPTGRIELYYEDLVDEGQALPTYEPCNEAYDENPAKDTYPLVFMQGKTRYRIHAFFSASEWFRQNYTPCVTMHPSDAAARGIAEGDDVHIFNDRGEFVCRAVLDEGIRPGVLFMAETTYSSYYKQGFLQNVTNSNLQERCYKMKFGPQINYNDVLVQVEKA